MPSTYADFPCMVMFLEPLSSTALAHTSPAPRLLYVSFVILLLSVLNCDGEKVLCSLCYTQTSKQHFKKHIVLPEVFLNSVSVGLKQNKLMKHSIFHCRQCCFPALGSWWQAAHMKNTLFIFLKFVYFLRISYICTVSTSFVPLPL